MSAYRPPRMYAAAWEILKQDNKLVLQVHPKLVKRVKRMMFKEKNLDLGFAILNENDKYRLATSYDREKRQLTFVMYPMIGVEDKVT